MKLAVLSPEELKRTINELYYKECIQHDTPDKIKNVLFEIEFVRKQYEQYEEYELCQVCVELREELSREHETRMANDLVNDLVSIINPSTNL